MPAPAQPSLTLTALGPTSFRASVANGSAGATHTLYYRQTGSGADTTGPSISGNGSADVANLSPSATYFAWVVGSESGAYSLPGFASVSLATADTLAGAFHRRFNGDPSLVAALSGGLWTGEVPEGTAPPYAWLDLPATSSAPLFESELEISRALVHVFAVGAESAESLASQFKACFDYQTLDFNPRPAFPRSCVLCIPKRYRLVCERVRYKDTSLVFRASLVWHVVTQKDR